MPSKSTFSHYDLSTKASKRYNFEINQFKGVDYFSTQLNADKDHAVDILNLVYKDNVIQKRQGWEQIAKMPSGNCNGFYDFYDSSNTHHYIAHIGTKLYKVTNIGQSYDYSQMTFTEISGASVADHKSNGFVANGKLYLLDGTTYTVLKCSSGTFSHNAVINSNDAYVPTIFTNVVHTMSEIETSRVPLDDVNMLTRFVNVNLKAEETNYTSLDDIPQRYLWQLYDTKITIVNSDLSNYEIQIKSSSIGYTTYKIALLTDGESSTVTKTRTFDGQSRTDNLTITSKMAIVLPSKITLDANNIPRYNGNSISDDCIGYFFNGNTMGVRLVLWDMPTVYDKEGKDVIVKFPLDNTNAASKINKCTFGIVYNNRLFISGNPDYPNFDWHSSEITVDENTGSNLQYNDFIYFSDLDYCVYGHEYSDIIGYTIYTDGSLVVVKEDDSVGATFFKRTKQMVQARDFAGNVIDGQYEEAFTCEDINSYGGLGGVNDRSIVNFMGKTILLTKQGLKTLATITNVYSNDRFLYDVSTYINKKILKEDIYNIHLFVDNKRLYVKSSRGVYIGEYDLQNENGELEWFFVDNINAKYFFKVDDELYFADNENGLFRFPKENIFYVDKKRTYVGTGGTLLDINAATNKVIINEAYIDHLANGNVFNLFQHDNDNIYNVHTNILEVNSSMLNIEDDNIISVMILDNDEIDYEASEEAALGMYDGMEVYADNITSTRETEELEVDTKYYLEKVDSTENPLIECYKLKRSDGTYVDFEEDQISSFRLSRAIKLEDNPRVVNLNKTAKTFQLSAYGKDVLDLIYYNNRNSNYSGIITEEMNVEAYFITMPYHFGNLSYDKNIYEWIISNDTNLASEMDVGYFYSHKQPDFTYAISGISGSRSLDLSNFNFNTVQFDTDNLPHLYAQYKNLVTVQYIRFLFKNYADTNMVLSHLNILYSIGQLTKGRR